MAGRAETALDTMRMMSGMSRADDQVRALETGSLHALGRVEQVGLFAYGLKTNHRGRRRAGVVLGALAVVVVVVVLAGLLVSLAFAT